MTARGYLVVGSCALVALLAAWWLIFIKPAEDRQATVQARAGATIAQGQTRAATDAVSVVVGNAERGAMTDDQTRKNDADIRAAPGAGVDVGRDVDLAGRRAVCLRKSANSSAACQQLLRASP